METSDLKITTTNAPRELLTFTEAHGFKDFDPSDFDYMDRFDHQVPRLFRYKKQWYDIGEFVKTDKDGPLKEWHGVYADTFFSGVVVRIPRLGGGLDLERVVAGTFFVRSNPRETEERSS